MFNTMRIPALAALLLFSVPLAHALVRDIKFPVDGTSSFRDDFHEPRGGGTREHLGIDIIAAKMTPLVAAVDGTVTFAPTTQPSYGYSLTIRDSDGYQYRYLHINNDTPGTDDGQGGVANAYAPGIKRGVRVTRGQHIGWVGDSGNAEATVSHLHFEIRQPDRTAINPYDSLVAAKPANSSTNPTTTVEHPDTGEVDTGTQYTFTRDLALGASGEEVRQLQLKLTELGYFKVSATGYFGPITQTALISFQRTESLTADGVVGAETRARLNSVVGDTNILGVNRFIFTKNLAEGSSGTEVLELQKFLKAGGYFNLTPTGYYGIFTKNAVITFQITNHIDPVGVVGPITRAALNQ